VAALHPHDGLGDACGSGDREAAQAAGGPGERRGLTSDGAEHRSRHGRDQGRRRRGVGGDHPCNDRADGELGDQRGQTVERFDGPGPAVAMVRG
jgi:hypothetical protein